MNTSLPSTRRGRAAATSALAVAVLALTLTGCGDDTPAASSSAAPAASSTETTSTDAAEPASDEPASDEPASDEPASDDSATTLDSLGPKDDAPDVDFPGVAAVFSDGSSAGVDGQTLIVTTAAEETVTLDLPTEAEGYFYGTTVNLGDAGTGYMITQSGGEYLNTFLVVLDDGELYLPESDDDVVFGQFAGEGPFFETYTTDDGAHLVTHVKDAPSGMEDQYYEWTVEDRRMVPTELS